MIIKVIVLSPFELPYSKHRGRYSTGDYIQFDTKSHEEVQTLLRLLEDSRYSSYIQPLKPLPEGLKEKEKQEVKESTSDTFTKSNTEVLKDTQEEKVNKILQPATLIESETKEEKEVVKEEISQEERYLFLDELHWTHLRALAEEEHGLTYEKFNKDKVIEDILSLEYPN